MKSVFKVAHVKFKNEKYNYSTSVNGRLSDDEIKKYFIGNVFNLGSIEDDVHTCIDCIVEPSKY